MSDTQTGDTSLELVEHLASVLEKHSLSSLEYKSENIKITLRKEPFSAPIPLSPATDEPASYVKNTGDQNETAVAVSLPRDVAQNTSPESPGTQQTVPLPPGTGSSALKESPDIITSPLVGIAYLAKEPGAEPFVAPGDQVKEGDILCLIEAMKMFNEIKAPHAGVLREIHFSDGELIEYGAALFTLSE